MAIVHRNGRPYLYRSVRKGGRVSSEYVASGVDAELMAGLDNAHKEKARALRERERNERNEFADLDQALDALVREAKDLARASLEAAGYHQHHRGAWRKRRCLKS